MKTDNLNKKIGAATKWSSITEVSAKLVSPITNMVLARLLTPEMFGVVATVNIIISFAEMFTDAGFQKYLIQHEFSNEQDKNESTTVAFWTNFMISMLLWGLIICFKEELATMVGNPGKGIVIAVASVVLPLTSFSSIQMALYKRDFDYKTLFYARVVGILIPLVVTVPSAFILRNYWALIIGSITKEVANAIILTARSSWKPTFGYNFLKLKEMIAFSMWTLFEQISIWLTNYVGTFIVGVYLTSYYVGLYKTAMATVTQFTSLITVATTPILFAALSRTQNDSKAFKSYFFGFQKVVGMLIIPMSAGLFLYRDFVTRILLGDQWTEATMFIGLWGITSCLGILLNNYSSEAYRALGKPKISLLAQLIHLAFLIPVLIWSAQVDFETLYWARSLVRFQMYITQMIMLYIVVKISFFEILKNIYIPIIATGVMSAFAVFYKKNFGVGNINDIISIILCIMIYAIVLMMFSEYRNIILDFYHKKLHMRVKK